MKRSLVIIFCLFSINLYCQSAYSLSDYDNKFIAMIENSLDNKEFAGKFLNYSSRNIMLTDDNKTALFKTNVGTAKYLNSLIAEYPISKFNITAYNEASYLLYYVECTTKDNMLLYPIQYTMVFQVINGKIITIQFKNK